MKVKSVSVIALLMSLVFNASAETGVKNNSIDQRAIHHPFKRYELVDFSDSREGGVLTLLLDEQVRLDVIKILSQTYENCGVVSSGDADISTSNNSSHNFAGKMTTQIKEATKEENVIAVLKEVIFRSHDLNMGVIKNAILVADSYRNSEADVFIEDVFDVADRLARNRFFRKMQQDVTLSLVQLIDNNDLQYFDDENMINKVYRGMLGKREYLSWYEKLTADGVLKTDTNDRIDGYASRVRAYVIDSDLPKRKAIFMSKIEKYAVHVTTTEGRAFKRLVEHRL